MSRSIDAATLAASKATIQCAAEGNAPRLSLWISRPVTQPVDLHFLETLDIAGLGETAATAPSRSSTPSSAARQTPSTSPTSSAAWPMRTAGLRGS